MEAFRVNAYALKWLLLEWKWFNNVKRGLGAQNRVMHDKWAYKVVELRTVFQLGEGICAYNNIGVNMVVPNMHWIRKHSFLTEGDMVQYISALQKIMY